MCWRETAVGAHALVYSVRQVNDTQLESLNFREMDGLG